MTREVSTVYFDTEGREHMHECIRRALDWCVEHGLSTVVIFTGTGEGPHYAAKELLPQDRYAHLHVIAVTPPFGRPYRERPGDRESNLIRAGINPAMRGELAALGISVIAAHLPFKEMHGGGGERVSEWTRVAEAFGVLGGGFALCVQAILVACDAGEVLAGERVVVASADTAFVALASRSESFLSPSDGVLVEHIICRPTRYQISKRDHSMLDRMWEEKSSSPQLLLPAPVGALPPAATAAEPPPDIELAAEEEFPNDPAPSAGAPLPSSGPVKASVTSTSKKKRKKPRAS